MVVREGVRDRMAESINLAVQHGDGLVLAAHEEKTAGGSVWHDRLFSTQYACPNCKISYEELEPRTFSFNSPVRGVSEVRRAWASRVAFDPELVLPDASLSLAAGAIAPWKGETPAALRKHQNQLRPFLAKAGIRWNTPLDKLSPKLREQLLHGTGKRFAGVLGMLEKEYATTTSEPKRQRLEAFRGEVVCKECGGARLRPEARAVRIAGKAIHEVTALTVSPRRERSSRDLTFAEDQQPDRPADPQRDRRAAGVPRSRRAGLPDARSARRHASAAASCSACGWPPGWARGWSACATCSTSRRSACIPATTSG